MKMDIVGRLFGGTVREVKKKNLTFDEKKIGSIGGMVQQEENYDEVVMCRDDAVGGRLQQSDDDNEMVRGNDTVVQLEGGCKVMNMTTMEV